MEEARAAKSPLDSPHLARRGAIKMKPAIYGVGILVVVYVWPVAADVATDLLGIPTAVTYVVPLIFVGLTALDWWRVLRRRDDHDAY